jgi:hypothetical protein
MSTTTHTNPSPWPSLMLVGAIIVFLDLLGFFESPSQEVKIEPQISSGVQDKPLTKK